MSIVLPSKPSPTEATARLIDFGATLTPPMGGPAQRLNRIGNRYALDVTLPVLTVAQRQMWIARLTRGLTEGVILPFPQPGLAIGTPGSFVVDGAAQQGMSLKVRGGAAGYRFGEGQFISIIFGGRRYLHVVSTSVAASSGGAATLAIAPMLRVSPNDGATVEVAQPMIEGFLSGNELSWLLRTDHNAEVSFTVTEAA